jgi:uncharacterized membrane protein (UPF0182 family)
MTRRRWLLSVLVAAAVILIVGRSVAGVYADYLWYEALGAGALWRVRMSAVAILRVGSGVIAALFAFVNLYTVRQSVVSLVLPRRLANLEIGEEVPNRLLMGAVAALSIVLGTLLAMPSDAWMALALARGHRSFGETDPYFTQDLGFFVYWLPLENTLWMFLFFTVIVTGVVVVALYALTPSLKWQRGALYASGYVRRHFTVLVGVLLLLLAWSFRLDMYALLIDGSGAEHAFTWADYRVAVPGDLMLSLTTLGAAVFVIWAGFAGRMRQAAITVIAVVVLALVVREIAPAIAARSGTDQQRAAREQPFAATRATYTRRAFGVDRLGRADSTLAFGSVTAALSGVSIWDEPALARAVGSGRVGDDLAPLIGWYVSDNGLRADVIDASASSGSGRVAWSVSRVRAAEADERGAPVPTLASSGFGDATPLDAPLVYPNASPTLVLADSLRRVAGTSLESFGARFATAWSTQNFRLLFDDQPLPHPTLISHRDIRDRLEMYAPFFAQGRRVDPVLVGDSLYWAVDLYSVSSSYPLSRHAQILGDERTYLHHAAVGIVQASTGDVMLVADSLPDPVTESWKRLVPSLFTSWAALPPGIRTHLAPPVDAIVAQAIAFGRFGARGDSVVQQHVPSDGADSASVGDPIPLLLPGQRTTAIAIPLVDGDERLRGLVIGSGGASMQTQWLRLAAPGPRWGNVLDRLHALDSASTRDPALVHGRVRVAPLGAGAAFIQSTYRWRGGGAPSLYRVVMLANDSTASIAPPIVSTTPAPVVAATGEFRSAVASLYAVMRDALRRGDFAAFGRAFEALGRALQNPRR